MRWPGTKAVIHLWQWRVQ